MQSVKTMSSLRKDFVASYLRSQLATLQSVLETIESQAGSEDGYIEESLTRVEKELRQLRKTCMNN